MRLIYAPVSTKHSDLINYYHPHSLFNPVRQNPKFLRFNPIKVRVENFADSGGYQLYRLKNDDTKQCIVVPAVGIRNNRNLIVIDPIDLCKRYGEFGVKYGFTLDRPLSDGSTQKQFIRNLEDSFGWASLMFKFRNLCADTELFVPLHYSTKDQLHLYYEKMSRLGPEGFAFPVRGSFDLAWIVNIACTLCFLYSKGVQKVHMFGSSRREVIVIGATAVGLKMFEQVSFDSRTWNTLLFDKRPKYFDPLTLRGKRIKNETHVEILLPNQLLQNVELSSFYHDKLQSQHLLMLHNALAISWYAENMAKKAEDLNYYKEYIDRQRFSASIKDRLLIAITILEKAVNRGYDFVQEWLKWIWL